MAVLSVNYHSEALAKSTEFEMVLPNDLPPAMTENNPAYSRPMKTFYLLHGFTGSSKDWLMGSSIQDIAVKYNLAVVMPSGDNSFYLDGKGTGRAYGRFIGEELIEYTRKVFHLSGKKEDTFIGGFSMGGFGAIHTGFAYPETFQGIFALSSALIIHAIKGMQEDFSDGMADYDYYNYIFGNLDDVEKSQNNPEVLIRDLLAKGADMPKLYMACGTEDFLLENNRAFYQFLKEQGYKEMIYKESKGEHNWEFWDAYLEPAVWWLLDGGNP